MDKKERFSKAYKYAYSQGIIDSQKDLAKKMGSSEPNISSALKGVPSVLTDRFLTRFCELFPIFRIEWLIFGSGDMLADSSSDKQPTPEQDLITLAASLIKEVEALRRSLSEEIAHTQELRKELTKTLLSVRSEREALLATYTPARAEYLAEHSDKNEPFAHPAIIQSPSHQPLKNK